MWVVARHACGILKRKGQLPCCCLHADYETHAMMPTWAQCCWHGLHELVLSVPYQMELALSLHNTPRRWSIISASSLRSISWCCSRASFLTILQQNSTPLFLSVQRWTTPKAPRPAKATLDCCDYCMCTVTVARRDAWHPPISSWTSYTSFTSPFAAP